MPTLSAIDLLIVGGYVLGMTLLGLRFSRGQKDLAAYFVGERSVGWVLVLASIVATETSAVTFLSVPGLAYQPGGRMTFLQLALGYIVGRVVAARVLLPRYMRGELFSAYQVLRERFGPGVKRVASGLFLVTRTAADGLRLYLTALVLQYVGCGVVPAVVAVGAVTVTYTYLGGMKAVLWTDLIQTGIKLAGAVLAWVILLQIIPGGWGTVADVGSAAGKFTVFDLSFDPTKPYTLWTGLIGGAVLSMGTHGADQMMVQRYLCARSLGHARAALVLSGLVVLLQFALFLLIGVGLFVAADRGAFDPAGAGKDEVFGRFIVTRMPVGVAGVLMAAVLAAAMSTLSSSLNSSANAAVTDFYRPLTPPKPERHYVRVSRLLTAMFGVAQVGVALAAHGCGSDRSVIDRVMAVAGFTTGLVLGLFLLGRVRRRIPPLAAIAGLSCGFLTVLGVWLPSQFGTPILAWPWFAPLGAAATVGAAVVAALLLPARPDGPAPPPPDGSPQPGE